MSNAARHLHETWLGMVQPTEGLVVSIPAQLEADAFERPRTDDHHAFVELLEGKAVTQGNRSEKNSRPG